jgi:hypothetical protein
MPSEHAVMTEQRKLLCHFLAALAYRTQKTLQDAPANFGSFRAADGVRTPAELISHMTVVLGYACTCFAGGHFKPAPLQTLEDEVARLRGILRELARYLESDAALVQGMSFERLLQGPFSDAMTHAGQLAMLRRFAGSPVVQESFIDADISAARLGSDQARSGASDEQ